MTLLLCCRVQLSICKTVMSNTAVLLQGGNCRFRSCCCGRANCLSTASLLVQGGRRRDDMLERLIAEHTPAAAASHAAGTATTLSRQVIEQQLWLQNTAKFERAGRAIVGQSAAMQTKQQSPSKTGLPLPVFRPIRVQLP